MVKANEPRLATLRPTSTGLRNSFEMYSQNRWHAAEFEASGARCEIVAVYGQVGEGLSDEPSQIAFADGRPLMRIAKGV